MPTFLGNAPEQYPVITITLTAVTGGSAASIFVGNNGTGQQLTITRTWSASDVLVIDTFNRTVKVNNVEVDFGGHSPLFAPGAGTLGYVDTFTTRTFTISAVYAKGGSNGQSYIYKAYRNGVFMGVLQNVTSEFGIVQDINAGWFQHTHYCR